MMKLDNPLVWRRLASLTASLTFMTLAATAATPLLNFEFNEANPDSVQESINNLTGVPAAEPPTSEAEAPSGQAGDRAIHFESGQYLTVDDPDTRMQLDPGNPSFTMQAWVKFSGMPAARMVFFYSNGPGGAVSFSVNTDRTVFVTTLGILDASSVAAIPDDGAWHHIAVVHENGVELRYYVDGVLADTRAYTSGVIFTRTETSFSVGAEATGGLQYVGSLDRLKITSGVLTAEELDSKAVTGPIVDTDKDGMPDDWETKYGLNPNDPSDAALDCNGNGVTNLNEYLGGFNPCDATPPTLVSATATGTFDTAILTFSEALDPATATDMANYTITPSLAVTAATYKNKVVTLTTAKQTPGATAYTVAVTGVKDLQNFTVPAGTKATFFSYIQSKNGVLKFSFYGNITGTAVDLLLADPRYPATPDWTGAVFSLNSRDILPTDVNENYGAIMEGYLTPTESGDYRFFVYSDDASRLYLSANETPTDPLYDTPIAEETGCCNPFTEPGTARTSEPISLVAGNKYYIEMVYKEGGGGDYGQVAWRKEGDPTPAASLTPIPGKYLSATVDLPAPAEGAFTTMTPAANAKNVMPDATVRIVHRDGKTEWTAANVTLKFDGVAVTPTPLTKDANVATITYKPGALLASKSTHTVTLGYLDPAGQPASMEWSFEVAQYGGPIVDKVHQYPALLMGAAAQTADMGGHSGAAGDLALDTGAAAGTAYVYDASFLNAATADDKLTIALFVKLRAIGNASGFWANSASSASSTRGFQAHIPWGDSTIYYDTSGCCDADVTRISANISTFIDYSGDATWWNSWHHFTFVKDGQSKVIYIDGKPFLEGLGDPLKTDFTTLVIGGGPGIADNRENGVIDDFVVYDGALTEAQALSLAGGAAPSSIAGLVAHWDFNDVVAASVKLIAVQSGSNVNVTSEPAALPAGWVLQTAPSVTGPWTTQAGATTPITVPIGAGNAFLRAIKP